ncbi:tetratricopeptide repeat protein [Flavobacteriaceae bacterium TP-CH-4]|uniref:Tetratricopeptide repeat protein n=1 Tax=Pelagihabitans pacificus TaxID=2696054 RepID=A0A967E5T2_9FLAO|nr:tetratricopeptide repeat protein [Pelagihabitans pacificus]NHF59762.1 tetratricopeptide repeat protein [Pelagihabitans pacificus]
MKTKILILATMCFSMVALAQKNEIKAAEKALKGGDAMAAKTALEGAAGMISGADAKVQAQYHYVRGQVYADLAKKGDDTAFEEAASSFQKVLDIEGESGKKKYSDETAQRMQAITADLVNSAVEDNANKKFKEAADKLYMSYKLSPQDTSYLYYAANSAVQGGDYDQSLKFYNELYEIGYDGSGVMYKATNTATGQVEEMDKLQRDLMVKSGTYTDPIDEKVPSKKSEIVKNIALIYTQTGDNEKAKEAFKNARASNPDDVNLVLSEANLYYTIGDKEKFKELMSEAAAMAPDNADLHYNIGVISMEQGNLEEARASYLKALEIDPDYTNAQLNLSTTYVNEGNGLIDEMNSLGNSRADIARYDELKQQKDDLFKKGADVLEAALKDSPDNKSILTQLKNIYGAMGDNENFMRLKKLLGE